MLQYIEKVVVPFLDKTKECLSIDSSRLSLAIFDHFKGYIRPWKITGYTPFWSQLVAPHNGCFRKSINKSILIEREFQAWYASEVAALGRLTR